MDETGINWNSESSAPVAEAPAQEIPQTPPPSPELPEENGGTLRGILGALLGALVGTIPWFLASTFADFFIGWLGFLTAVASAWGYRKLKGRKSLTFATVTVILCSMFSLFAAEIVSWMYVLCTDPEWQADAAYYGISVVRLAWESILMPENWSIILPSVGMGMFIGLLGVICIRPSVKRYVLGDAAVEANDWRTVRTNIPVMDEPVPAAFVVRDKKSVRVLLRVLGVAFVLLFAGMELFMTVGILASERESGDGAAYAAATLLFVFCAFLGVFLVCHARRQLVVEGSQISYLATFGKAKTFTVSDIAGMQVSANGRKLMGRDGKVLARMEDNQENSMLFLNYLRQHGVGLSA